MIRSPRTAIAALTLLAACANGEDVPPPDTDAPPAAVDTDPSVDIACVPQRPAEQVAGRASPYDSVRISIGALTAQICYGRPSMRGRVIFAEGELVPPGQLWRTGADEPTTLHLPFAASIAGIDVSPGHYSIYTIPGESEWTVIVNASTSQWGVESEYTGEVEAREVGRATVPRETIEDPVEQFTIRVEPAASGVQLLLEWEDTRVRIPFNAR